MCVSAVNWRTQLRKLSLQHHYSGLGDYFCAAQTQECLRLSGESGVKSAHGLATFKF